MTQAPYRPMRTPQKDVSQERMAEILAKHAKPQVSIKTPEVGETPKVERRPPPLLAHEMWLADRLGQHGVKIFTGDTVPEQRMKRFREAIKGAGIACVIVGRNKQGDPETYEDCFARLYREPL